MAQFRAAAPVLRARFGRKEANLRRASVGRAFLRVGSRFFYNRIRVYSTRALYAKGGAALRALKFVGFDGPANLAPMSVAPMRRQANASPLLGWLRRVAHFMAGLGGVGRVRRAGARFARFDAKKFGGPPGAGRGR